MATQKELYNAAMLLKESCKNANVKGQTCFLENGERCPFDCCLGECSLSDGREPNEWYIKKIRRFTDEEVALAKAFKSIGAVEIRGCIEGTLVISENDTCLAALTLNVFKGISTITLPIDEIIKDGEEE